MIFGCWPYRSRISISSDGSFLTLSIIWQNEKTVVNLKINKEQVIILLGFMFEIQPWWLLTLMLIIYCILRTGYCAIVLKRRMLWVSGYLHGILYSCNSVQTSPADGCCSLTNFLFKLINVTESHIVTEMLPGKHKHARACRTFSFIYLSWIPCRLYIPLILG